jgi:Flp pilus assembly protein TadG
MERKYKGSFTIETALLMPVIALVFVVSVWGSFYYHDKNILSSCAYEIAVVGSTKVREKEAVTEAMLNMELSERLNKKCILFTKVNTSVHIGTNEVIAEAEASRRNMRIAVRHTAAVTKPESYIRKVRKISKG